MSNIVVIGAGIPGYKGPRITSNTRELEKEMELLKQNYSFIDGKLTSNDLHLLGQRFSNYIGADCFERTNSKRKWRWAMDFKVAHDSRVRIIVPCTMDFRKERISLYMERAADFSAADKIVGRLASLLRERRLKLNPLSTVATS